MVVQGGYIGGHEQRGWPAQTVGVHVDEAWVKLEGFRSIVAEPWDRAWARHVDRDDSVETRS